MYSQNSILYTVHLMTAQSPILHRMQSPAPIELKHRIKVGAKYYEVIDVTHVYEKYEATGCEPFVLRHVSTRLLVKEI